MQEYWSGLPFPSPRDLPDQGWNLCPLHCKADSQSLDHQRNPLGGTFEDVYCSSLNEGKIELQEGKEMEPHIVGR